MAFHIRATNERKKTCIVNIYLFETVRRTSLSMKTFYVLCMIT